MDVISDVIAMTYSSSSSMRRISTACEVTRRSIVDFRCSQPQVNNSSLPIAICYCSFAVSTSNPTSATVRIGVARDGGPVSSHRRAFYSLRGERQSRIRWSSGFDTLKEVDRFSFDSIVFDGDGCSSLFKSLARYNVIAKTF